MYSNSLRSGRFILVVFLSLLFSAKLFSQGSLSSFAPKMGGKGDTITIYAYGIGNVTSVTFGNIPPASFSISHYDTNNIGTIIKAVLGQAASGNVEVTAGGYVFDLPDFLFLTAPYIYSYSPHTAGSGDTVRISGTSFTGATSVVFGNTPAQHFTLLTDSVIEAIVGNGSSGSLFVYTPKGVDTAFGFIYNPVSLVPQLNSFSPVSGTVGTTIHLVGSHFTGADTVLFGNIPANGFTVLSDTAIDAVAGPGASGSITVKTPYGNATLSGFTYVPYIPVPKIISFSPTHGITGTKVLIYGSHFTGTSDVGFGGTGASSVSVKSDTVVEAVVGTGSSGMVSVTTPLGSDSLGSFLYIDTTLLPVISSFSPGAAPTVGTITIRGKNLSSTKSVRFGGVPSTHIFINSDTSVTATVGNGASGYVSVTTSAGTDSLAGFRYIPAPTPRPIINSFSPKSAGSGMTVMITGKYFTETYDVTFGLVHTSFHVLSDTLISVVISSATSGYVMVYTKSGYTSAGTFTFLDSSAMPHPVQFSPASGTTGTPVTITGYHLSTTSTVSFGGMPAQSYVINSDSSITAVVGDGSSGKITVTLTNGGMASLDSFLYIPGIPPQPPVITSFSPTSGTSGSLITITGRNFSDARSVAFGGVYTGAFSVQSDSVILASVGSGASGKIFVTTPYGFDSLDGFSYIRYALPVVNSFSPSSGKTGDTILISGLNFTGTKKLTLGGSDPASYVVLSDSLIMAIVGSGASGNIFVENQTGIDVTPGFIYLPPIPSDTFKLLQFNSVLANNLVTLQWTVLNDRSMSTYIVERSLDSVLFHQIGSIAADTNGNVLNIYQYPDFINAPVPVYYRLLMVDTAGHETPGYSIKVINGDAAKTLILFPNPATTYATIVNPYPQTVSTLEIVDLKGIPVNRIVVAAGNTTYTVNLMGIFAGLYKIVWTNGNERSVATLLIR